MPSRVLHVAVLCAISSQVGSTDPIPRDFGKHPVQGGRVYDAADREVRTENNRQGDRGKSSKGPTAHFLNEANNLQLSCSACRVVFPFFKEELEGHARPEKMGDESDTASEHISAIVDGKLSAACRKVEKKHALQWALQGNQPLAFEFSEEDSVPTESFGTDLQRQWAKEFLRHRCGWLKDVYSLEISIQFAEHQLPKPVCPIKDCVADAEQAEF